MKRRVLIVDDTNDPQLLSGKRLESYSDIVILYWIDPDGRELLEKNTSAKCHGLAEVVGGLNRWERSAFELTSRVCDQGPAHGERPWRKMLEESLYRESLMIQAATDAYRFSRQLVQGGGPSIIDAMVSEPVRRVLRAVSEQDAGQPELNCLPPLSDRPGSGVLQRLCRRARHAWLTGGWRAQAWDVLNEADREYVWRCRLESLRPIPALSPEGITFFSSYLNNSRSLGVVEKLMPLPVRWVVLNESAREGAQPTRAPVHWLWSFLPRDTSPADDASVDSEPDRGEEIQGEPFRSWLSWSPMWRYWTRSGGKAAGILTACWSNYLRLAKPRLVVTASQWGFEGWLMAEARKQGIPTLQLLHGVLAGYFHTGRAIESDAMVVWGEFWRDLFPEEDHGKIHVANPGNIARLSRSSSEDRSRQITYFSWPLDQSPFYNPHDFQSGMIDVLSAVKDATGCRLCVRAHPLENIGDFVEHWRRRKGSFPPDIELSQYEPFESVLQRTDVALMYRSTILLDCQLNGIPAVIPGWIEYGWGPEIKRVDGVCFAKSFGEIRSVLQSWISQPPPECTQCREFVLPPGEGVKELRLLVDELVRKRQGHRETESQRKS
jgi:hypothetical protein